MTTRRIITGLLTAAAFAVLALSVPGRASAGAVGAAAKLESARQSYMASVRREALRTGTTANAAIASNPGQWLARVKAENVNMVTNRIERSAQKSVNINGKSYFVANEAYAKTLMENSSIRFATDPMTGARVDKAEAIAYADASGRVLYFSSDESYRGFIALGAQKNDTVFGYSEPK